MKTKMKFLYGIAFLTIVAIAAFNVNLNMDSKVSLLTLANIEALAGEGVEQCEITKYNRNAKESWVTKEYKGRVGVNGYVTIKGTKFGPFNVGINAEFNYQAGDCPESSGNCCLKKHINKVKLL